MELKDGTETFYASLRAAWRDWLATNHQTKKAVWLIIYRKESKIESVYYPEAVDEALCFGWIDSKANKRDSQSYYQFFSQRNPKSNWSKINKDKVAKLIKADLMTPAGLAMIDLAKNTGTWDALNDVDAVKEPDDLMNLLIQNPIALLNWNNFAKSARRGILEWILNAKKPETRSKRIEETVALAAQNIKANFPKTS